MALPLNIDLGYSPVWCITCEHEVYVPAHWQISQPYICTLCQKRAQRRIENATEPWVGRVGHGATVTREGEQ